MAVKIILNVDPNDFIAFSRICAKVQHLINIAPGGNFSLQSVPGSKTEYLLVDRRAREPTSLSEWLKEHFEEIDVTVTES
ncbi:MAG: hypothetical protein Q8N16_02075 [bacterium]|nr:hypothetical protein [bacterium]